MSSTIEQLKEMTEAASMKVGDRVRVKESVVVYNHPSHRNEAFDIQGLEGEIQAFATEWQGKPISANYPIVVKFEGKYKAHLRDHEIELI
jgi:hypothetical protein